MFARRNTFGHFVTSYCCGIVAGVAPLWEAEGSKEVAVALNEIWKDESTRPEILFYDLACRRRRYLVSNPEEGWDGTLNYVDRLVLDPRRLYGVIGRIRSPTRVYKLGAKHSI